LDYKTGHGVFGDSVIRVLKLTGDPRSIGRQHGEQVIDLRPQIIAAMQVRLAELNQQSIDPSLDAKRIAKIWEKYASSTLEMLSGMAEALDLDWEEFFTYTIASFLSGYKKHVQQGNGCTTWAANQTLTCIDSPLLVKNRDHYSAHQPLQCLAHVQPEQGFPYLCLTSAGSPGVYSSGINSQGLAVADTYVASKDIGPGIARYSLMMDLLEKFGKVQDATDYLYTLPHIGDGTVILADAQGELAVFEISHSKQVVVKSYEGFLVSTNHFTAPEICTLWVDNETPDLKGNSLERRRRVENALRLVDRRIDVLWCQTLMAQHGNVLNAICRHPEVDANEVTISSIVFLPKQTCLYVANGFPCQTQFELFGIED
jgi:isopenicillin-N N-acyltransferase like protein